MAGRERQHDRVLGGCSLQLEIELAAKTLAQCKPPRAIDPAAERRMYDELHAAGFVEEALEDDRLLRGHRPQRRARGSEVRDELLRRRRSQPKFLRQIGERRSVVKARHHVFAQPRYRERKLVGSARRFAQPERNVRRLAARILDAQTPGLDAQDPVRRVAELEDVPCEALDRKILVDRADQLGRRLEDDVVVGGVGNRATRRDRGEASPRRPRSIPFTASRCTYAARWPRRVLNPSASMRTTARYSSRVKAAYGYARVKTPNRASSLHSRAATSATICWARTSSGLGGIATRSSSPRRMASSSAAHSTSSSRDNAKSRRFRLPRNRVIGASRALQEGSDRARRAELAHQLDVADVDAKLERGGGHERPQFAALQALLGRKTPLLGETSVVRRDDVLAESGPKGAAPRARPSVAC